MTTPGERRNHNKIALVVLYVLSQNRKSTTFIEAFPSKETENIFNDLERRSDTNKILLY